MAVKAVNRTQETATPAVENASTPTPDIAPDPENGSIATTSKKRGRKPSLFVAAASGYQWNDDRDKALAAALKLEKPPGTLRTGASVASYLNTLEEFKGAPVTSLIVSNRVEWVRDVFMPSKQKVAPAWLTLDVRHRGVKAEVNEDVFA
jgi:hypothetical protein